MLRISEVLSFGGASPDHAVEPTLHTTGWACNCDDGAKCDGMVAGSSAYGLEQAWMVFLEIKNEIGTGSSDPSIQASFAFQMYWHDVCGKPNME